MSSLAENTIGNFACGARQSDFTAGSSMTTVGGASRKLLMSPPRRGAAKPSGLTRSSVQFATRFETISWLLAARPFTSSLAFTARFPTSREKDTRDPSTASSVETSSFETTLGEKPV